MESSTLQKMRCQSDLGLARPGRIGSPLRVEMLGGSRCLAVLEYSSYNKYLRLNALRPNSARASRRAQKRSFWKNHLFLPVLSETLYLSSNIFFTSLRAFCFAVWLLPATMSAVTTDLSSHSSEYRVGMMCV